MGAQLPTSRLMGLAQDAALGFGLGSEVSVRPFKVGAAPAGPPALASWVSSGPRGSLGALAAVPRTPAISSMTSASEHAEVRLLLRREAPGQASAATSRRTSSSCPLPLSRLNLPIYLMGGRRAGRRRRLPGRAPQEWWPFPVPRLRARGLCAHGPHPRRGVRSALSLPDFRKACEGPASRGDPGSDPQASGPPSPCYHPGLG